MPRRSRSGRPRTSWRPSRRSGLPPPSGWKSLSMRSRPPCAKAPVNSLMSTYAQLRLAAEAYAVPIDNVVEIAILGDLTLVPGARAEILGVRNLRGQIMPVIDLAQVLGLNPVTPPRQLLVAESGSI